MKNNILLLKTLLLSTSRVNKYKYCNDKKTKGKIIGSYIGLFFVYLMIMGYSLSACIGYGIYGMAEATPLLCALIISAIAFFFTIFKTNGYLFNFKEYDMLMSLPFEAKTVAACKFMYMYVKSLPWYLSITIAMMIGYGFFARPAIYVYPLWLILSFFIPIIPMLVASFLGFLIAKISSGFRKSNLIQTVLVFIFVIFCFSFRYIIEAIFRDDKVEQTLESTYEMTSQISGIYLPASWFFGAVTKGGISDILLLLGVSILLFAVVFYIVGNSYRQINSALKSHAAAKDFRMSQQKKHSVVSAIAYKEFKRMTGSTAYITNIGLGEVFSVLLGVLTLVFGFDKIVSLVTQDAPFDHSILQPAIPFIIYFFIGMVASTACSPSLEGKNWWILQSLPLEKKTIYKGKMLFNMYLTVPFMCFGVLCMSISAGVPVIDMIFYLILGIMLCAFSTAWGCVCGIKHMKLDWENEIEVIKQSPAVAIYMLPNMFVVMGLVVGVVFLGMHFDHKLIALVFILIAAGLAALCYARVMALAKK